MTEPRIAEALLRGFIADPGVEEAILGDLAEERCERAEGSEPPGPGTDRTWYWEQTLRSAPHLLRGWWLQQSLGQAARTLGRVGLTSILTLSLAGATFMAMWTGTGGSLGPGMVGDPHSLATSLLLAGGLWAVAGGFFLARTTPRAPMCPVVLLGLSWIPAVVVPSAILFPHGPPGWFLVAFPIVLPAVTLAGGGVATILRGCRHAEHAPRGEADPSTREEPVKTGILFRLAARPLLVAAVLLMVPLVAMQFTSEVNWSPFDFAFAGALILGVGFTLELALLKTDDSAYRWAVGIALLAAFLLVWVGGSVGIIGADGDPANAMYAGVLAVGAVGALLARFRPDGMAWAMIAAAVAQALVALVAIVAGFGRPYSGALELTLLNGFWIALFLVSARLFRTAAEQAGSPAAAGRRS